MMGRARPANTSRILWCVGGAARRVPDSLLRDRHFVSGVLRNAPATLDSSAWYFGNMLLLIGIAVGVAAWGFSTSLSGRIWTSESFIERTAR
jgi:hypothetical protein